MVSTVALRSSNILSQVNGALSLLFVCFYFLPLQECSRLYSPRCLAPFVLPPVFSALHPISRLSKGYLQMWAAVTLGSNV